MPKRNSTEHKYESKGEMPTNLPGRGRNTSFTAGVKKIEKLNDKHPSDWPHQISLERFLQIIPHSMVRIKPNRDPIYIVGPYEFSLRICAGGNEDARIYIDGEPSDAYYGNTTVYYSSGRWYEGVLSIPANRMKDVVQKCKQRIDELGLISPDLNNER